MASLVREIERFLSGYYGLDTTPDLEAFVRPSDRGRETLVVREQGDHVELALHLPRAALEAGRRASFDEVCQVVEGISHLVYIAERARRELPTTFLELELQAEVDKYVLMRLAEDGEAPSVGAETGGLRAKLFGAVAFVHPAGSEQGDRYRLANGLAARFSGELDARYARRGRFGEMRELLRRFYGVGQTQKIELALAT